MIKKVGLCAALVLAAALALTPRTAAAQQDIEPAGFGVGFDVSLSSANLAGSTAVGGLGVGGINGNYWVSPSVMLNFILTGGFALPDGGDLITRLGVGFGVFGVLARGDRTVFMLGGRFTIAAIFNASGIPEADDNQAGIGLDIPLRIEHWLDRHFAVNGQVGISIGILPDTAQPFAMGVGTAAAWGSFGFTFYLDPADGPFGPGGGGGGGPAPAQQQTYQPPPQQQQGGGDPEQGGTGW
jgi:hypothetical protein